VAHRATVYASHTCVVELEDVQELAPEKDIKPLVEAVLDVLADTFGKSLVGYSWDFEAAKLYVTFKKRGQAVQLRDDWSTVVAFLMEH